MYVSPSLCNWYQLLLGTWNTDDEYIQKYAHVCLMFSRCKYACMHTNVHVTLNMPNIYPQVVCSEWYSAAKICAVPLNIYSICQRCVLHMTFKTVHTLQYHSILSYTLLYNTKPHYVILPYTSTFDKSHWLQYFVTSKKQQNIYQEKFFPTLCPYTLLENKSLHLEIDAWNATTFLLARTNDSEGVSVST